MLSTWLICSLVGSTPGLAFWMAALVTLNFAAIVPKVSPFATLYCCVVGVCSDGRSGGTGSGIDGRTTFVSGIAGRCTRFESATGVFVGSKTIESTFVPVISPEGGGAISSFRHPDISRAMRPIP